MPDLAHRILGYCIIDSEGFVCDMICWHISVLEWVTVQGRMSLPHFSWCLRSFCARSAFSSWVLARSHRSSCKNLLVTPVVKVWSSFPVMGSGGAEACSLLPLRFQLPICDFPCWVALSPVVCQQPVIQVGWSRSSYEHPTYPVSPSCHSFMWSDRSNGWFLHPCS